MQIGKENLDFVASPKELSDFNSRDTIGGMGSTRCRSAPENL